MWKNEKRFMRRYVRRCSECGKRLSYMKNNSGYWSFICTNCGNYLGRNLYSPDYCLWTAIYHADKDYKVKMDSRCKPCPFCGEQPYRFYSGCDLPSQREYFIGCTNHCIGTRFGCHTNLSLAICDWNHQVVRRMIDGVATCPWCGEVATSIDKEHGRVSCNNPDCIARPYISYRMTAESEVYETPEQWLNLWNGVNNAGN